MTEPRNIPWKRIAVEAAAIVASILLAFAIDAWWQDQQQRDEQRLILQSILDEFEDIRGNARTDLESTIEMRKSVLTLLQHMSRANNKSVENIDSLLADTTWINTPSSYSAPVLQSAVSGGYLSIISNPELRLELGTWSVRFSDIELIVIRDSNMVFERLLPFYGQQGSLLQIISSVTCKPGAPEFCTSVLIEIPEDERMNHENLFANRKFQGVLAERMMTLSDTIDFGLAGLDEQLGVTIDKLWAELDK